MLLLACYLSRYWLILSCDIAKVLLELDKLKFPLAVLKHVVKGYNKRVNEMDTALGRLVLFLEPRYRAAIDKGSNGYRLIARVVRTLSCYTLSRHSPIDHIRIKALNCNLFCKQTCTHAQLR